MKSKPTSHKLPIDIRNDLFDHLTKLATIEGRKTTGYPMPVSTFIKHLVVTHPKMKGFNPR